ncbi:MULTISPECIES: hypothetical protein [unclassified Caulobacter]|uniref:hypothetical protein n=1 Tax=unclassified Caulobacter TaxID=2648921 RepID=UPI001E431ADA|nr:MULTISPECIES: hypothetical protein [unclassified Caulobacter]
MIALVTAALLGAMLGLWVRPRLLGVVAAVGTVGLIEAGVLVLIGQLELQPNREHLIAQLQFLFGAGLVGAATPVLAALVSAWLAAVMGQFSERPGPGQMLTADGVRRKVGKDGRYRRLEGMVEERAIHARAESRIDEILGL